MWSLVFWNGKEVRDESRGAGLSTFAKRAIICLRQNDHRLASSPGNVLRFSLQSRVNDLAELGFRIL
jgi:hypothetical protein